MSDSPLVTYTNITPKSNPRTERIMGIVLHHWSGVIKNAKQGCDYFCSDNGRQVSANYVIGNDGSIGQNVRENRRAWTSSNKDCDQKRVTVEISNCSKGGKWPISDAALKSTIALCADICKRERPEMREIAPGHSVRCHCLDKTAAYRGIIEAPQGKEA